MVLAWGPKPKPCMFCPGLVADFNFGFGPRMGPPPREVNCWRRTLNLKGTFPSTDRSPGLVPTAAGHKNSTLASGGSQGCLSSRGILAAGEDWGGAQDLGATRFHHEKPNLCKKTQKSMPSQRLAPL